MAPVVEGYVDNAFVNVAYPTSSFPNAFVDFTPAAAALAVQHADVLTNATMGPMLDGLTPTAYVAHLSVFARGGRAEGVTADLVFAGAGRHRTAGPVTVRLTGDLFLERTPEGPFKIFGFRLLNEAVTPETTTTATATVAAGGGAVTPTSR